MKIPEETIHYLKSFLMSSDNEEDLSAFDAIPDHEEMLETAFRMLSRYDEYEWKGQLDKHSRFRPEDSWLGSRGLMQTPVLDEYTERIYRYLGREKPHRESKVYLTHDVDSVVRYRRLRGFAGGVYRALRGVKGYKLQEVFGALTDVRKDPDFTFPLLKEIDAELPEAEVIYFLKPNVKRFTALDRPVYKHAGKDFERMMGIVRDGACSVCTGLHSLYYTYDHTESLKMQNTEEWRLHRAHYLRVLPPEKMHLYCEAGITDDFSLGYASQPGFRLGTTRAVKCIDPRNGELLPLILHPLTIMDTTLSDERYLGLGYEDAYKLCVSLIDTTLRYEGDVTLLFHNGSFKSGYNEKLYRALIEYLRSK